MMRVSGIQRGLSGIALAAALTSAAFQPVQAADTAAAKSDAPVDVELPAIFAPMMLDGRLDSYAYITVLLTPAGPEKALPIRAKMPFLRDAFLRELNKGAIAKADDPKAVDSVAVKARLLARMNRILPVGTVSDLKFEPIVFAAVQPQS